MLEGNNQHHRHNPGNSILQQSIFTTWEANPKASSSPALGTKVGRVAMGKSGRGRNLMYFGGLELLITSQNHLGERREVEIE